MAQPPSAMEVPMDREYIRYITTAKDGQCQHTVGNDPVDLIGNGQVLPRAFFLTALCTTVLMYA